MSPEQREALIDSLQAGVSLSRACRAAGLTEARVREIAAADDALRLEMRNAEFRAALRAPPAVAPEQPSTDTLSPPEGDEAPVVQSAHAPREEGARWAEVRRQATLLAPGMLGCLLWLDRQCALTMPPMSEWWRFTFGEFYASAARWLLLRVGRGGGKSTTLQKFAAAETLFGERWIPDGETWIWPFISVSTPDSARRIDGMLAVLRAAKVIPDKVVRAPPPSIEILDTRGQSVAFVALASTIAGVSGPSSVGGSIDEEAKLRDRAGNANPSTEIIASMVGTFRGRDGIRACRCSSAFDLEGSHYVSIEAGSNDANHVARIGERFLEAALAGLEDVARWEEQHLDAHAAARIRAYARTVTAGSPNVPTWIANPSITAIRAREDLEAVPYDPAKFDGLSRASFWLREFASLPMPRSGGGGVGLDQMTTLLEANRRAVGDSPRIFGGGAPWEQRRGGGGGRIVF